MDDDLERAIDEVGRGRVFLFMEASGWNRYDTPPKWVWWQAVHELREADALQEG